MKTLRRIVVATALILAFSFFGSSAIGSGDGPTNSDGVELAYHAIDPYGGTTSNVRTMITHYGIFR